MNELALFAGAGGGILGGKLLGWRTRCAVEIDAYARSVLLARQRDGCLDRFPVWDDVTTFDGKPWSGSIDVISGGFPCQDISVAGAGAGIEGPRSGLWKEFARIIGEVGPRFVLVENSPALTSRGLGIVLGDLATLGYDARWGVLGAHHAGAPHRRDRIWIVANDKKFRRGTWWQRGFDPSSTGKREQSFQDVANSMRVRGRKGLGKLEGEAEFATITERRLARAQPSNGGQVVSHADSGSVETGAERTRREAGADAHWSGQGPDVGNTYRAGLQEQRGPIADEPEQKAVERGSWWSFEPELGRVAHGVANRVDRIRAIGNGQVPAVVRLAWETLAI